MGNAAPGAEPRVLGPALVQEFLAHDNLVAWVNGHTHDNQIRAHGSRVRRVLGDQHRLPRRLAAAGLIEVMDNDDGSLSIFCTMIDRQAKRRQDTYESVIQLASLSRLLSANDWQLHKGSRGRRNARNVELLLPKPALA